MKKNKIINSILAIAGAALIALPTLLIPFKAETSLTSIDKTKTGSITIHKYEQAGEVSSDYTHDGRENVSIPDDAKPLAGVEFSIWYLGDNIGTDNYMTTVAEAEQYISDNNVTSQALETNTNGIASFSNLKLGQYLVKETKAPENVSEKTPAFIVNVPTTVTIDDKDQWLYDIHVYPKNQTIYGSVILNKVDEQGNKLSGAEFRLYAKSDDENDVLKYENLTTNEYGQLIVEGLPKGDYYFVETKAPEGYGLNPTPIEFTITASGTVIKNDDGIYVKSDENQTVVELTVINNKEPNIHKGIKSVTNQYSGYNFGEAHKWVISPDIPADIDTYNKFIVTDTIDDNLIFSGLETVKIYVDGSWTDDADGVAGTYTEGTLLTENTDYTISFENGKLEIIFINDTFKGGQTALKDKEALYIFFETTFDETKVSLGSDYQNKAELTFNNGYEEDKEKESETPKVHTGGLSLLKYTISNNENKVLEGAEFRLATSEENAKAGIFVKNGDNDIIGISDKDGIVKLEGIAYGNDGDSAETGSTQYWLVETKAPEVDGVKYNLLDKPVEVTVNASSHIIPENISDISAWTVSVINKTGINLPTTGGIGTILFYLIGAILMGSAVVMFVKNNKKSKKIS